MTMLLQMSTTQHPEPVQFSILSQYYPVPWEVLSSILRPVEGCGLRRHYLFGAACFDGAQHAHIVLTVSRLKQLEEAL